MITEYMKMGTNARLVSRVFTRNKNTFYALKELIDNSLYAKATEIKINIVSKTGEESVLNSQLFERIEIYDNGMGVPYSQFRDSIMQIATDNKAEGYGIGRFSALQIGKNVHITTTAYEPAYKAYTITQVAFDFDQFKGDNLSEKNFVVKHTSSQNELPTGYQVVISKLFHNEQTCNRKNKLGEEFQLDKFPQKLFEAYPLCIFEEKVKFYVNGKALTKRDFVIGRPSIKSTQFTDLVGITHEVKFEFFSMKHKDSVIRIFLQSKDGCTSRTELELTFNSDWYDASYGTQYILVESPYLTRDICESFPLQEFNKEWSKFANFIKEQVDEYFKKGNKKYQLFLEKLITDDSYPYTDDEKTTHAFSINLFNNSAFIIENDLKILESNYKNRNLVYTLLRKVIEEGDYKFIFEHVLGLSKDSKNKLVDLLDQTNLEEIVNYSSVLAKKQRALELLEAITITDLKNCTDEYKKISVLLKRNLWLYGDEYYNCMADQPDRSIIDVFEVLFKKYVSYKPLSKYNNRLEGLTKKVSAITANYFTFIKQLGNHKKEIVCINWFAPSIRIGQYEITQINNYILSLEKLNTIDKEGITFKIYFIGTDLDEYARSVRKDSRNDSCSFLYKQIKDGINDITAFLVDWKGLVAFNRELLTCSNKSLKMSEIDIQSTFLQDYPGLMEGKSKSQLHIKR